MSIFLWLVFLTFGILIIAPLILGDLFNVDIRYKTFKYVSITMLIWWLLIFIRLMTPEGFFVYYTSLFVYPMVYLFTLLLYIAIKKSMSSNLTTVGKILLWLFFIVDLIFCLTNNYHGLVKDLAFTTDVTRRMFDSAQYGDFFLIHTIFSYVLLAVTIYLVIKTVFKRLKDSQDVFPFLFIIIAILIGVGFNIIQVFFYKFLLDPTLLTAIVFVSVLYYVFYIRDLKLILGINRNRFILDNLREMYVIVSDTGFVVDASSEFKKRFNLKLDENLKYVDVLEIIYKSAILYQDTEDIIEAYDNSKIYLNTIVKKIKLPFYKHSGTFYLFFDQSSNLKYVNDMNYIKTHDLMSKLYNRNFLEDLRDDLDDANDPYSIILFDLDGLKLFNDYLGHDEGDQLIKRFANQLINVTKEEGVYPIRLGGDEFLILAKKKDNTYIEGIIKSLEDMNAPLPFIEKLQYSYAISSYSKEDDTLKKVITKADMEMYEMKKEKGNYKTDLKKALKKSLKQ